VTRQRVYYEHGQPVEVITWWAGRGPRNVLIRRADGTRTVRPFRGLRRQPPAPRRRRSIRRPSGGVVA
jgi:acetyl esterase